MVLVQTLLQELLRQRHLLSMLQVICCTCHHKPVFARLIVEILLLLLWQVRVIIVLYYYLQSCCIAIGTCGTTGNYDDSSYVDIVNAKLGNPYGLAIDNTRSLLYIADRGNNRVRVVNLLTAKIRNVAGDVNGAPGNSGDGGSATAALLTSPSGVAIDTAKNLLYIADTGNNLIRMVNLTSNIITTYAGISGTSIGGYFGDGGSADSAQFRSPTDLVLEPITNTLFVSDSANNKIRAVYPTCNLGYSGPIYTACSQCQAGTFAQNYGQTSCTNCPTGKYSSTVGATSDVCVSCPVGTYAPNQGTNSSSLCLPCPTGTASPVLAAALCTSCALGNFAPNKGSSACTVS